VVFLRNVLITTDLSAHSLAALEYAFTFGLLFGARMSLLHVVEHGHHRGEEQGVADLAHFVATQVDPRMKLEPAVRSGRAEAEIRRFAQEQGMDLIVMATHGKSGLKHAVMGSVVQKVVRLSTVPVLVVRPRQVRESILRFEDIENELHLR
jgi:nucleotide-binding universal stress UspA family protein